MYRLHSSSDDCMLMHAAGQEWAVGLYRLWAVPLMAAEGCHSLRYHSQAAMVNSGKPESRCSSLSRNQLSVP